VVLLSKAQFSYHPSPCLPEDVQRDLPPPFLEVRSIASTPVNSSLLLYVFPPCETPLDLREESTPRPVRPPLPFLRTIISLGFQFPCYSSPTGPPRITTCFSPFFYTFCSLRVLFHIFLKNWDFFIRLTMVQSCPPPL